VSWNYPTVIYLSRGDFPRMLEAEVPPRSQVAVRLGTQAGLRPVEIRHVTPMDVDEAKRQIHVHYCSRSKPRAVPIDRETLELIEDYTRCADRHAPIIRPERGYEMRSGSVLSETLLCIIVKDTARVAGIVNWRRYYPYLLRHFFALDWADRKGNLLTLQRILGHRNIATTNVYLNRLVFWDNHLGEYDRIKGETQKMSENEFYQKWCSGCDHEPVCGFRAIAHEVCHIGSGCRRYKPKEPAEPAPMILETTPTQTRI